jgi:iron(III) transport system permease protein
MHVAAVALVVVCIVLPLLWLAAQLLLNLAVHADLLPDRFRLGLVARTLFYNLAAGVVATLLALPAAWVLGRGRGAMVTLLWVLLPCALLMPSLVFAYGWQQCLRLAEPVLVPLGLSFSPGGAADVVRCILTLAAWLWPLPACIIGLVLCRLDPAPEQQAALDGARGRILLAQLRGPMLASAALVTLLALQEFAVYEPTGISVMATEVRMVYETGAFSSLSGGAGEFYTHEARTAAALAISAPLLVASALLALLALRGIAGTAGEVASGEVPRSLRPPGAVLAVALIVLILTMGSPIAGLLFSLRSDAPASLLVQQIWPQLLGSLATAGLTALLVLILGMGAAVRWLRGSLALAVVLFLVGGQLLAIVLVAIFNRPWLLAVYDSIALPVLAYVGRFGWIALVAARLSWGSSWRELRDLARVDGANATQCARWVVLPLVMPLLLAAALVVGALSLSEVPATMILSPQQPQVLTPTLMGWVHIARSDAMIQASLVLVGTVIVPAAAAVILVRAGTKCRRL